MNHLRWMQCLCMLASMPALLLLNGCRRDRYTMDDFAGVSKIDAHVHMNSTDPAFVDIAKQDNFRLLTINTDYADFPPIEEQLAIAKQLMQSYPGRVAFASTFHMTGWGEPQWLPATLAHLDSTFTDGAVAVKAWKNIGMEFRDKNGKLVMIDDPGLDPVFSHLKERNITLIGHQSEARDCWLPIDQMRVVDLKEYYTHHPQFHMYNHPELPSYMEHAAARDRMLDKHRDLTFMGAHLASLEWDVDTLGMFFDKYPEAVADLGARMNQIQYQSARDREKVRQFFIKYQDRIVYATDISADAKADPEGLKDALHHQWMSDWKYLCTDSTMTVRDLDRSFQGLNLPREAVDKIYRLNAEKTFPKAWKSTRTGS